LIDLSSSFVHYAASTGCWRAAGSPSTSSARCSAPRARARRRHVLLLDFVADGVMVAYASPHSHQRQSCMAHNTPPLTSQPPPSHPSTTTTALPLPGGRGGAVAAVRRGLPRQQRRLLPPPPTRAPPREGPWGSVDLSVYMIRSVTSSTVVTTNTTGPAAAATAAAATPSGSRSSSSCRHGGGDGGGRRGAGAGAVPARCGRQGAALGAGLPGPAAAGGGGGEKKFSPRSSNDSY
jgi:hypothetical protein